MSYKSENAVRLKGGPGNPQDATKAASHSERESGGQQKTAPNEKNANFSAVSGGGGERDKHHSHDPESRS